MKYWTFVPLLILLLNCTKDEAIVCENDESQVQPDHIKYFGFTLVDTYFDDPTDAEVKSNYIDEVHAFSNTADILVVTPTDNLLQRIQDMNNLDMKAMLHLNELFFEYVGEGGDLSGALYNLRPDYQERWDTFVMTNQLIENQAMIQAFYVGEEPTWNGIDYAELSAACDYIKATVPVIPIMIVEAYPALEQLTIPSSVDWIGFDHYFIKNPSTSAVFQAEYALLEAKKSNPNQRTVLIMDTHYIPWAHGDFGGIEMFEMSAVASNYYSFALEKPDVIGLFGYHWPNGFDFEDAIGARGLNEALTVYEAIGKEITGKQ